MNATDTKNHIILLPTDDYIEIWVDHFLNAKRKKAKNTVKFYREILNRFIKYCESRSIKTIQQFTPQVFREFFMFLESKGSNLGGQASYYRCLRAWLYFYELELDIETNHFTKMLNKAKPEPQKLEILETISPDQIKLLLESCEKGTFLGERDRLAIFLLYDCGFRAQELCDVTIEDVSSRDTITIQHGKGDKKRMVAFGDSTRRQIRRFEKFRPKNIQWLLCTRTGDKLKYSSLREIVRRACRKAGIPETSLHSFRRAFASNLLRSNTDLHTIKNLLGHADLSVLDRYLKQNQQDLIDKFNSNIDDLFKR